MFFFKKENETPKRLVAVLGTSPLASFLTCVLQENNIEVVVLSSSNKDNDTKTESCVLKSNFQNQNFSFKVCKHLNRRPEYCFLASSYDEYKNDLIALSDNMLKGVKVINFSSFYNHEIIAQLPNIDELRAYFNSWLIKDKKDLILLSRNSEIVLCQKEDDNKDIHQILFNKKIEIKTRKDDVFGQKLASWFLGNMLILAYNDDISKLLLNNEKRQKVDKIIKEIAQVLKVKGYQIDTQTLLTDVYAFPDGFESEYNSPRGRLVLTDMMGRVDRFDYPELFELIGVVAKKC